ncbi:PLP-dependent transferase [Dichomitus squalens]|uniref:alanine--glyoxylate transaminase n=1 Tax=Dichomitus squalens TaxID=114155 RepID=A0A4Q9PKM2_9APHY|nr:PLP-dependent transferase [Dichomitus squalens]TBU54681.1 PLP-dependent transferase [Dichomitus squalens]
MLRRASVRVCLGRALRLSSIPPPTSTSSYHSSHLPRTTAFFLSRTMSTFHQEPHKLLVIPGPIEVTDEVLYANAHPSMSHISPDFIPVFGDAIRMTREVLFTQDAQPFLIAGSGTLGWDQVAANLVEPGENALVLNSGYFGDSFADCLRTYGAVVDEIKAPFGGTVPLSEIEAALKSKKYKLVTFTHVDTSTGVLSDARGIAATVRSASPDTLVVADAVCSVASEEIRFDAWGLDVVLTASQKGLGTPPGLSILVASQRAIKTFESRKSPVTSYYASWTKWLPIMQAYESGNAAYFATPPVNLIYAYNASLRQITGATPSLEERFRLHRESSQRVKKEAEQLGFKQLPLDPSIAANGMTALWFPEGLAAADLLPSLAKKDVVVAGGLHKDYKLKYFRIGHMGVSAIDSQRGDIDKVIAALKESLAEAKAKKA